MAGTELWLVDLKKTEAALESLEAATPRLSDDIRQRLDQVADEAARRERRLAHVALRILLEARIGPGVRQAAFVRAAGGKPALAGHAVAFSLSHTRGLALIALGARDPLGVDIERMRQIRVPAPRRAPIEAEAVALAAGAPLVGHDADARFLHAWVRIEAAAKAHGHGVGALLERLRPGQPRPPEDASAPRDGARSVVVHDVLITDDVLAAIALAAGHIPPPLRTLPDTVAGIGSLLAAVLGTRR